MSKKVFVGMSGGVDSSVTAALLKQQGYDVTGVYMKNWSQNLPGMVCPWKQDYQDAKRVAVHLGIPFKMYDFEKEYRQLVVDYMIREYRAGRTPNPDIMCNQEVKFRLFLETALKDGADMIATGHYARIKNEEGRIKNEENASPHSSFPIPHSAALYAGKDANKDQSYFLYRVSAEALSRSLMPIGEYKKSEVRELARKFGLATADKKDSQGICFVGKVGIKDFLLHELGPQPHGEIIDQNAKIVGEHDGALFYTIGQRHGLGFARRLPAGRQGGLPFYVTGKDMDKNIVYVTTDLQDGKLWSRELKLTDMHWINGEPMEKNEERRMKKEDEGNDGFRFLPPIFQIRTRYRAPLIKCRLEHISKHLEDKPLNNKKDSVVSLRLDEDVRAVTPGQSAVIYAGEQCLGGGIVI